MKEIVSLSVTSKRLLRSLERNFIPRSFISFRMERSSSGQERKEGLGAPSSREEEEEGKEKEKKKEAPERGKRKTRRRRERRQFWPRIIQTGESFKRRGTSADRCRHRLA